MRRTHATRCVCNRSCIIFRAHLPAGCRSSSAKSSPAGGCTTAGKTTCLYTRIKRRKYLRWVSRERLVASSRSSKWTPRPNRRKHARTRRHVHEDFFPVQSSVARSEIKLSSKSFLTSNSRKKWWGTRKRRRKIFPRACAASDHKPTAVYLNQSLCSGGRFSLKYHSLYGRRTVGAFVLTTRAWEARR